MSNHPDEQQPPGCTAIKQLLQWSVIKKRSLGTGNCELVSVI